MLAPRQELRALVAGTLRTQPIYGLEHDRDRADGARFMSLGDAHKIADAIIKHWRVLRQETSVQDDGSRGFRLEILTPPRPETNEERVRGEERLAACRWAEESTPSLFEDEVYHAYHCPGPAPAGSPDAGPPPQRTSLLDLLAQRTWWMTHVGDDEASTWHREPIRVDDMDHNHRLNLLGWLWRRAERLRLCDAVNHEMHSLQTESLASWFERQPLVLELRYRTTPWGESPATWHPVSELPPWSRGELDRVVAVRCRVGQLGFEVDDDDDEEVTRGTTYETFARRSPRLSDWVEVESRVGSRYDSGGARVGDLIGTPLEWRELTLDERDRFDGWAPLSEAPRDGTPVVVRLAREDEPVIAVWRYVAARQDWCWVTASYGIVLDETAGVESSWRYRGDVYNYCEHVGYEREDCEICESRFFSCPHGGTRDSDYCSACEQE